MMLSSEYKAKVKSKKAKGHGLANWRGVRVVLIFFLFPFSFFGFFFLALLEYDQHCNEFL